MRNRLALPALVAITLAAAASPATPAPAASSTPVWIGAPFAGSYRSGTLPGQHGGINVATDFFAPAGTAVRFYAAPRNSAYNNQIKAFVVGSGPASCGATKGGYWVRVEVQHNGNPIGWVTYSHMQTQNTYRGELERWWTGGAKLGRVGYFSGGPHSCWWVTNPGGAHTHIEFRNLAGGSACMQNYGARSIGEHDYMGYIGDWRPPLSGMDWSKVCPNGI